MSAICYPHTISKTSFQFFLQLAFNDEGKKLLLYGILSILYSFSMKTESLHS
jgi:hypothetical protein